MSFIGDPYKFDIFVSYSHGDVDGGDLAKIKRYQQDLIKDLREELEAYPDIGKDLKIFLDQDHRRDQSIDPTVPLGKQLEADVAASAMFLPLITPRYLGSDWCRREREWWFETQAGRKHGTDGRLLNAYIWPDGGKPWPPELKPGGDELLGFCFFDKARAQDEPQPHGWLRGDEKSKGTYDRIVLDLARRAVANMKDQRVLAVERKQAADERAKLNGEAGQAIFLHGRESQRKLWTQVSERLVINHFGVLPGKPEPDEPDAGKRQKIHDTRIETLTTCDAMVILCTDDDDDFDRDLAVVGKHFRQSARERMKSAKSLPCAVVDVAGVAKQNPIRERVASNLGIAWIDGTADPWVPDVRAWLRSAAV